MTVTDEALAERGVGADPRRPRRVRRPSTSRCGTRRSRSSRCRTRRTRTSARCIRRSEPSGRCKTLADSATQRATASDRCCGVRRYDLPPPGVRITSRHPCSSVVRTTRRPGRRRPRGPANEGVLVTATRLVRPIRARPGGGVRAHAGRRRPRADPAPDARGRAGPPPRVRPWSSPRKSCAASTATWCSPGGSTPRPPRCSGTASSASGPSCSARRPRRSAPAARCARRTTSSRPTASTASPGAAASTRSSCSACSAASTRAAGTRARTTSGSTRS